MACYNIKRFRNNVKDEHVSPYDKHTLSVPCGNCPGCAKAKQNDWLVRSYFEFTSYDYTCYFVSLDFDNEHLPLHDGIPCFDSHLMTSFFESMRDALQSDFRYLYSSHLGDAMKRPHYHVAFLLYENVPEDKFVSTVERLWKYGSHEDISKLRSVKGNPMSAFEYICKYTVFSFDVKKKFRGMESRYRPRTQASIGFGSQALDPLEFNSARLLSQGVRFHENAEITRDYMLFHNKVYIDIRRDGTLIPFSIPRYYEMKLFYESSYDATTKRTQINRNEYFVHLQEIRHNAHYIKLYNDFSNSRSLELEKDAYLQSVLKNVFPESPYNGVSWSDVVDDCLIDSESFFDFCKYYSWLQFDNSDVGLTRYRPLRYRFGYAIPYGSSQWHPLDVDRQNYRLKNYQFCCSPLPGYSDVYFDDIDLYIYAVSSYMIWREIDLNRKGEYERWKIQEQIKEKIKQKCRRSLSTYWHLRRHGFKFYTLKNKPYVSHYQIREDSDFV